jgi:hypothetical protein
VTSWPTIIGSRPVIRHPSARSQAQERSPRLGYPPQQCAPSVAAKWPSRLPFSSRTERSSAELASRQSRQRRARHSSRSPQMSKAPPNEALQLTKREASTVGWPASRASVIESRFAAERRGRTWASHAGAVNASCDSDSSAPVPHSAGGAAAAGAATVGATARNEFAPDSRRARASDRGAAPQECSACSRATIPGLARRSHTCDPGRRRRGGDDQNPERLVSGPWAPWRRVGSSPSTGALGRDRGCSQGWPLGLPPRAVSQPSNAGWFSLVPRSQRASWPHCGHPAFPT